MSRVSTSRRHSLALGHAAKGLTMLEIMIVIAILGLVMGLVVVPKVMGMFGESKNKIAKLAVDKYAFEAYPQWSLSHTDKACPDTLLEVAQHVGKSEEDTKDPWGTPYKIFCGAGNLPASVKSGIAVMSFGEDRQEGTPDDIKSWEKPQ
jgi:general secretion pathway protein G